MSTLGFQHDEFSRSHLREWYDTGRAPWDWETADLLRFERWIEEHADELYDDQSWSQLAAIWSG